MPIQDFYPFNDGQKITAAQWNELLDAIRDGSFFLSDAGIGNQIQNLEDRVVVLEQEVAFLKGYNARSFIRAQFELTLGQASVDMVDVPILDSEMVHLNGLMLSKTGVPAGFVGDYSLSGSIITFNPELKNQIVAGDILTIVYQKEVSNG